MKSSILASKKAKKITSSCKDDSDRSKIRTRNFATVVYPESAPSDWLDIINDLHIPCFVSPLHDQDIDAKGKPKKPHYHVMLMFDNVKTVKQAENVFKKFNGVGCEIIDSLRGYSRYLCHLDDYDKHLYNIDDVLQFGGARYLDVIGTMSDKFRIIREMTKYIREHNVIYFCDFSDYASENNSEWFDALCNNCAFYVKEYIKSRTFKNSMENY